MSWVSAFSSWGWAEIVATFFVVMGVVGEVWAFFMKVPFNPTSFPPLESKKKKVEKWSLIILLFGVFIELPATVNSLKEAADAGIKLENLRADDNWLFWKVAKVVTVEPQKFAAALNGKPKKDIIILYPPDNDHAQNLAKMFELGFLYAKWKVLECRPYDEKDILPVFTQLHFSEYMTLSMKLGVTTIGSVSLIQNEVSLESMRTNQPLGAVMAAMNLFPTVGASFSSIPDPRLSTNMLKIVIGSDN
jgi:hypothetical protein